MKGIKAFVKHLKEEAPEDHILAYISKDEAKLLKSRGGSGKPHKYGILSFFASSPGDTGGAGGADGAGGNDAGGGATDTGDMGSEAANVASTNAGAASVGAGSGGPTDPGIATDTITSFGNNYAANMAAYGPLGFAVPGLGLITGIQTAIQTDKARQMMGLPTLQAPMGTAGGGGSDIPATPYIPTAPVSNGVQPKQNFFNLGIVPLLLGK